VATQTLPYREPTYVGNPNIREPFPITVNPAQNAVWRRGDILVQSTTGTIALPPGGATGGSGSLAGTAGPATSTITLGTSASATAPALTYYGVVTYDATGPIESLPSSIFVINCAAGFLPTVSVAAAGAPAAATGFRTYLGLLPDYLASQIAVPGTTLGTTFTAANPLTNYAGAARGATNLSGNILGMAICASNETYFDGYGGSFTAGNPSSRLGATNQLPPLTPDEAPLGYVVTLGAGTILEMSLHANSGGWGPLLVGTQFGLTLDATTGWFTVDTTQTNKVGYIVGQRPGVYIGPTQSGNPGDYGVRVDVQFISTTLLVQ
jgi:hypothetical protein